MSNEFPRNPPFHTLKPGMKASIKHGFELLESLVTVKGKTVRFEAPADEIADEDSGVRGLSHYEKWVSDCFDMIHAGRWSKRRGGNKYEWSEDFEGALLFEITLVWTQKRPERKAA